MPFNGFRGTVGGAVQTAYTDQPGVAVPGQIAFASDLNQCDAHIVGETNGLAAGRGIKLTAISDDISLQRPNSAAFLPGDDDTKAAFAGVVVFDEAMQSDENAVNGWAKGRVARIVKPGRAGGRIYVLAKEDIAVTDTVNWVTIAGTDGLYAKGEFSPDALAGDAEFGTSVALDNARWIAGAAAGGVAILELF